MHQVRAYMHARVCVYRTVISLHLWLLLKQLQLIAFAVKFYEVHVPANQTLVIHTHTTHKHTHECTARMYKMHNISGMQSNTIHNRSAKCKKKKTIKCITIGSDDDSKEVEKSRWGIRTICILWANSGRNWLGAHLKLTQCTLHTHKPITIHNFLCQFSFQFKFVWTGADFGCGAHLKFCIHHSHLSVRSGPSDIWLVCLF